MTFANISVNRERLILLSQLLLTTFPGCVIHQSCDPMRMMQHLSSKKVDAVFTDMDTYSDWSHIIKEHHSSPSVYLLCPQELHPPEETEDIRGVVTYPLTKQRIEMVLQSMPQGIREVY